MMKTLVEEIKYHINILRREISDQEVVEKYEEKILSLNNADLSYYFAKEIEGSNKQAHGQVVIKSKDPEYNFLFACYIDKYDVTDYYLTVLASGNKEYIELFRNLLPNSKNINKHTGSEYVISKFTDELSKKLTYKK